MRCVFSLDLIHSVDDQLATLYKSYGKRCPFGDFRATWWKYHCQRMSGPEFCPYPKRDCALAFFRAASLCVSANKPGAMFRVIATDHAMKRLERKPLARETESRSPFTRTDRSPMEHAAGESLSSGSVAGVPGPTDWDAMDMGEAGESLRRPLTRPVRIGTLLGTAHIRSRQVPAKDGREGS